MLKGGGADHTGGLLQFLDQLPGIQGVHKVNIAGTAIEDGKRQFAVIMHIQLCGFLVGITAVLQLKFFHFLSLLRAY